MSVDVDGVCVCCVLGPLPPPLAPSPPLTHPHPPSPPIPRAPRPCITATSSIATSSPATCSSPPPPPFPPRPGPSACKPRSVTWVYHANWYPISPVLKRWPRLGRRGGKRRSSCGGGRGAGAGRGGGLGRTRLRGWGAGVSLNMSGFRCLSWGGWNVWEVADCDCRGRERV